MINKLKDFFGGYQAGGAIEYIIAGLGNPGKKYEDTRHNVGFLALDHIARENNIPMKRLKFQALCGDGTVAGKRVLLLKPSTYMNNSGEAVRDAAAFYKIPMEKVLVLCDDITLEPGKLRIRRKGSDGGQKGLRSIIYLTGEDQFPRIRIGIGPKPHPNMDLADWVLSRLGKDQKAIEATFGDIHDAAQLILSGDIDKAMSRYN